MDSQDKPDPDHRCNWCLGDALYEHYHDTEWGVPNFDDHKLFEFLILEGAQAGLSWITILRKRDDIREAFSNFDAEAIAAYQQTDVERLMNNDRIIRNRLKIESVISNARAYLDKCASHGQFADYIWQFVDHKPQQNHFRTRAEVPATTPESQLMSKTLKKAGFRFVGPTICYAFMQATGMVNDHLLNCFRYDACRQLSP